MKLITLTAALALSTIAVPAFAQTSGYCLTKTIFGQPLANPMCGVAVAHEGGSNWGVAPVPAAAAPVAPVEPVVTEPVEPTDPVDPAPTEVPSTPLTPATANPGVYSGNLAGTPYEGTAAGPVTGFVLGADYTLPSGVTIPAGTYSGMIAPNGMFVIHN